MPFVLHAVLTHRGWKNLSHPPDGVDIQKPLQLKVWKEGPNLQSYFADFSII
jgi:hypothetical protein